MFCCALVMLAGCAPLQAHTSITHDVCGPFSRGAFRARSTDFQEGDAATLYESVHGRLFTLPAETLVLPAHDYKGRSFSTIGAQRASNPRLTKTKAEFVELMAGLKLPYPKKLDTAVPANLQCGVFGF